MRGVLVLFTSQLFTSRFYHTHSFHFTPSHHVPFITTAAVYALHQPALQPHPEKTCTVHTTTLSHLKPVRQCLPHTDTPLHRHVFLYHLTNSTPIFPRIPAHSIRITISIHTSLQYSHHISFLYPYNHISSHPLIKSTLFLFRPTHDIHTTISVHSSLQNPYHSSIPHQLMTFTPGYVIHTATTRFVFCVSGS